MSTDVLERTEEDTTTDDADPPRVAHYYDKKDLERIVISDATIEALCGKRAQPLLAGDGLPICERCQAVYNTMRNE
jgi:hypothetical protein